jgi:hypothetical protein
MEYKDPFLALPDYRENLILDLLPGVPSGTIITDASGKGHIATKIENPDRVDGGLFPVLDFTNGGYIRVSHAADLNFINQLSFVFWFKHPADFSSETIINKGNNYKLGPGESFGRFSLYCILVDDSEEEEFEIFDNTIIERWSFGEWTMGVIVLDNAVTPATAHINSINGVFSHGRNRSKTDLSYNGTSDLIIGRNSSNDSYEGQIAMMRMYDTALSLDQIKKIYQYTRRHVLGLAPKV